MVETMQMPRVVDNDEGEIFIFLGEREIRRWSYRNKPEWRIRWLVAREWADGWTSALAWRKEQKP